MIDCGVLANWPGMGLKPVDAMKTPERPGNNSVAPLMPMADCDRLLGEAPK